MARQHCVRDHLVLCELLGAMLGRPKLMDLHRGTIRSFVDRLRGQARHQSGDELALTYFVNGNTNTLPMYIWSMLRQGIETLRLR